MVITLCAYARLAHLGRPKEFIFDEVYYVKGAQQLLKYGVEADGGKPVFVVHPPIGKWVIALGIKIFGDHPFGWRVAVAVLGISSILLVARIAFRLFGSESAATLAALLYSCDALVFVQARTALLDPILLFWLLLGVYFLVRSGPHLGIWNILAFLSLGLATATKWSGGYFVAAFTLWTLLRAHSNDATLRQLVKLLLLPLLSIATYCLSWMGWFRSEVGYDRYWSSSTGLFGSVKSLIHYHVEMINFHLTLHSSHPYMAKAWTWLFLKRPTAFYYSSPKAPTGTCRSGSCSDSILAIGTPVLWWGAIAAILFALYKYLIRQDQRLTIPLIGLAAGWLPWLVIGERTIFFFYAIILSPWLVLLVLYLLLQIQEQKWGRILTSIFVIAVVINFYYLLPILDAQPLPYSQWYARMWFATWI